MDSGCMNREVDAYRCTQKITQTHPQAMCQNCHIDKHPGKFIDMGHTKPKYRETRAMETHIYPQCPLCVSSAGGHPATWLMGTPNLAPQVGPPVCGDLLDSVAAWPWLQGTGHRLPRQDSLGPASELEVLVLISGSFQILPYFHSQYDLAWRLTLGAWHQLTSYVVF